MASSGWQGDVTLQSGGFGYDYFKGNLRIDSISHSGDTVTVTGAFGVHNAGGYSSYYVYPINAAINGSTNYQQVVAGNQWIANGEWVTSNVSFSFSASAGTTSKNIEVLWNYNNGTASNSITYTLYFDASYSAPTGLSVQLKEVYTRGAKFYVSVSSMGNPSGSSERWVEAGIAGQNSWVSPSLRSSIAKNTNASNIVVDNNSGQTSTLTINPNTQYYYGGYATNTVMNASTIAGTLVTKAEAPTVTFSSSTSHTATFSYSTAADGGKYTKKIQYSLDGTNWVEAAQVTTGNASSGTFTVSGLNSNTSYTLRVRTSTTAGNTSGSNVAFTTKVSGKLYGSVNNQTKKIKKLYCSVGGQTKKVKKLYGSVNGVTKLLFEEEI